MKVNVVVLGFFLLIGFGPPVLADVAIYDSCRTCHGEAAEGNDALMAPQLAGQGFRYLVEQLKNYRSGARGHDPVDVKGRLMSQHASNLTDGQIESVAKWLAQLQPAPNDPSVGNPVRGKVLYDSNCLACHGAEGSGVDSMYTPNLRILSSDYIAFQLESYKKGWRGHSEFGTTRSKAMRTIVIQADGESDIDDISAFLQQR